MNDIFQPSGPPPSMPRKLTRAHRGGPQHDSFCIDLKTTTPIFGGSPVARQLDDVDVIRSPTIRGHLRFWWRTLLTDPVLLKDPKALFDAEARLWGRAADWKAKEGRSEVELTTIAKWSGTDVTTAPDLASPEGYALFPARIDRHTGHPRRPPGLAFTLRVSAPASQIEEVQAAAKAWVLFGGYGSRVRRGLGSLTASQNGWLPTTGASDDDNDGWAEALRVSLRELLPATGTSSCIASPRTFPSLCGATLMVGRLHRRTPRSPDPASAAWIESIGWLREFRQGPTGRDPGTGAVPGRSRWPEPDKLRHLTKAFGHPVRYSDPAPLWPRAEFGLPIVGQFKGGGEPPNFALTWAVGGKPQDRMASPLIVKALPTREGFRPCALWFVRDNPSGEVVAVYNDERGRQMIPASAAPFGIVGSSTDQSGYVARTAPVRGKPTLREAFLDWVALRPGVRKVLP